MGYLISISSWSVAIAWDISSSAMRFHRANGEQRSKTLATKRREYDPTCPSHLASNVELAQLQTIRPSAMKTEAIITPKVSAISMKTCRLL
jgi:hypothetical protein